MNNWKNRFQRRNMEEKKESTLPELQQEYAQLASKRGDLDYRILCLEEEKHGTTLRMKEVNQKAFALQQAQADIKPKVVEAEVVTEAVAQ